MTKSPALEEALRRSRQRLAFDKPATEAPWLVREVADVVPAERSEQREMVEKCSLSIALLQTTRPRSSSSGRVMVNPSSVFRCTRRVDETLMTQFILCVTDPDVDSSILELRPVSPEEHWLCSLLSHRERSRSGDLRRFHRCAQRAAERGRTRNDGSPRASIRAQ